MNAFSRIDMAEVTRLTKLGRLTEAVAVIQGSAVSSANPSENAAPQTAASRRPAHAAIDLTPPVDGMGAWSDAAPDTTTGAARASAEASETHGLTAGIKDFLARVTTPGSTHRREPFARPRPAFEPLPEGARFEERVHTGAAGSLAYKLYVPSGYEGQALPLVVMLHGCTQSPDDFAAGTRMNALAEEQTFLVAYPAQSRAANASRCWNWFNPTDQERDRGEPSLIAGMTREILQAFGADSARVYVAGLSAGGAAAAIMGAAYPDLYAAVGVHSGLACGAARDMPSAFAAMKHGGSAPPRVERPRVPTIVFHGDKDGTVSPINGDQVAEAARPSVKLKRTVSQGAAPSGQRYTRTIEEDATRRVVLEQWVLHGAGHAWSGGSPHGSYTDPSGPDASREMLAFFRQHRRETTAPGS